MIYIYIYICRYINHPVSGNIVIKPFIFHYGAKFILRLPTFKGIDSLYLQQAKGTYCLHLQTLPFEVPEELLQPLTAVCVSV